MRSFTATAYWSLTPGEDAAMLEQMQLSRLGPPNLRDLRFLVDWMKAPSMGNVYLLGPDSDIWEKPDHLDMIAINPRESDNSLSRLITKVLIYWYHRLVGWKIRVRCAILHVYQCPDQMSNEQTLTNVKEAKRRGVHREYSLLLPSRSRAYFQVIDNGDCLNLTSRINCRAILDRQHAKAAGSDWIIHGVVFFCAWASHRRKAY